MWVVLFPIAYWVMAWGINFVVGYAFGTDDSGRPAIGGIPVGITFMIALPLVWIVVVALAVFGKLPKTGRSDGDTAIAEQKDR
jgi:hypothetical protein